MPKPLLLYSTNTWMAFAINEQYYKGLHWVWCSPFFRADNGLSSAAMPASAIPAQIYSTLYRDVKNNDLHSPWVERNKVGILKGVAAKQASGVINSQEAASLTAAVQNAPLNHFRPLLFVIPAFKVRKLIEEVPPNDRANPFSKEYRITKLPRGSFDVLELPEI